jgi:hypothetical protein
MFNIDLDKQLQQILQEYPQGISEFNLLRVLQKPPLCYLPSNSNADSLILFRSHFWLFHNLYRLRQQGRSQGIFDVQISSLNICLTPYTSPQTDSVTEHDGLQEYYADLSHLWSTAKHNVEDMLDDAFTRIFTTPEKARALAYFQLQEPVTLHTIKKRYRQLAQTCHPDKGGDPKIFMALQDAMNTLKQYYQ